MKLPRGLKIDEIIWKYLVDWKVSWSGNSSITSTWPLVVQLLSVTTSIAYPEKKK